MVPSGPVVSHGSPRLLRPVGFGMSPPSVQVWPPSLECENPPRFVAAVSASSDCCESLYPTATSCPETAIAVSLWVVWSICEPAIAVSGQDVAVGYNDSQQSLLALTAATNLGGFSHSSDGGQTWTDGGDIPNPTGRNNLGDPWLTTGPDGTMYYSQLVFDAVQGVLVGVS